MAGNNLIEINIYEDDMVTLKTTKHGLITKVPFGTVRRLLNLLKVDFKEMDKITILSVLARSGDELFSILDTVFPDMTEDDWDHVDTGEIIGVIYQIAESSLKDIIKVPVEDSKNA